MRLKETVSSLLFIKYLASASGTLVYIIVSLPDTTKPSAKEEISPAGAMDTAEEDRGSNPANDTNISEGES